MAAFAHAKTRFFRPRPRTTSRLRPPPSAAVIDAVLQHADLRDDLGGGRAMLRLSPERLAAPALRRALGGQLARAGEVAIIWDEREDVIFRVLDGAPPPLAAVPPAPEGEDRFALTPAALAYVESSQSRGKG